MEESIPPIAPTEPMVPVYKDRSTGLMIFGVLTLMLGCLAGLLVPLMLAGQAMAAQANPAAANFGTIIPVVAVYGTLAVALIWLGIGSIQARRWARALLLIFSWSWLAIGVIASIGIALLMPTMLANISATVPPGQPQVPVAFIMVIMLMFLGFGFILLPAIWVFFYHSRHVKATCETRDPVTRWTDAVPLPVLALWTWMMFGIPMMLLMPLMGHIVLPFFGMFLTGLPGVLYCLLLAALWAAAAWLVYHLKPQGWWLLLFALIVLMVSSCLTFTRHDILEMYQLMGYPQAQIDQMQKLGLFSGNRPAWLMAGSMLPFLAYLFFIKRHFRSNA